MYRLHFMEWSLWVRTYMLSVSSNCTIEVDLYVHKPWKDIIIDIGNCFKLTNVQLYPSHLFYYCVKSSSVDPLTQFFFPFLINVVMMF